jgi:hypothetical protein
MGGSGPVEFAPCGRLAPWHAHITAAQASVRFGSVSFAETIWLSTAGGAQSSSGRTNSNRSEPILPSFPFLRRGWARSRRPTHLAVKRHGRPSIDHSRRGWLGRACSGSIASRRDVDMMQKRDVARLSMSRKRDATRQAKIAELLSEGIGDSESVLQPLKPTGPRGVVPCAVRLPTAK